MTVIIYLAAILPYGIAVSMKRNLPESEQMKSRSSVVFLITPDRAHNLHAIYKQTV
jgi:hypothetical protein